MWTSHLNASVLVANKNVIHAYIRTTQSQSAQPWMFTRIYGPPQPTPRMAFWQNFDNIITKPTISWLLMGDFSEVVAQHEKKRGRPVTNSQVIIFNNFINDNALIDLGFQGDEYTWTNNQIALDRGLVTQQWIDNQPHALLKQLPRIGSDHAPILL
ncbi:uncharacterized protein LOC113338912 [Papaver somniferum]|uniref:uncharacterized protein LOC113338912 n=1 Tax=Papaver somniferum TaxID=3469 RepID=UPI000E6F975D|nr:uncharacterized protein LOC113338912 [Papaver somniferum]